MAIVLIHELHTSKASMRKLEKNAAALGEFIAVAGIALDGLETPNRLHGPMLVGTNGATDGGVNVFVGRAVYDWNAASALVSK